MTRRVYLASSWRNELYPAALACLRQAGHEVYDFRNPAPNDNGFSWREIDEGWKTWSLDAYIRNLRAPAAQRGFGFDKAALDWCDTCVLLLPCGKSAHLEAGYCAGQGKRVIVLLSHQGFEPELMYLLCTGICTNIDDVLKALAAPEQRLDNGQALAA